VDDEQQGPFAEWVTFPEDQVISRNERLLDDRGTWALDLLVSLPRPIAHTSVRAQLELAGFLLESDPQYRGLVRFFREDGYVWGLVSDHPRGGARIGLVLTRLSTLGRDTTGQRDEA
jgi:hypothetical protein